MFRKQLFLESLHKLGLSKSKEDTVISLFEATLEPNDNDELNMLDDENPSDNMDYLSGEVEDTPEGSALEEPSEEVSENKQEIQRIIEKLDSMLEPFRRANVHQYHLPNTPNGTRMMVELEYRLHEFKLGGEYHDMRQAMQMMSWEVIQFNKADDPAEAWKLQFNPGAVQTKKYNAIIMIRQYMQRIDRNLEAIKETVGII